MKKVIGINALFLVPNAVGGTEYHLRSFVKYLQQLKTEHRFVLFCNKENFETFSVDHPQWKKVLCPISGKARVARLLYEQVAFPLKVSAAGCAVLHSYGYFGPLWGNFAKVTTIHDANWKDHPEDTAWLQNQLLNFLITQSAHRSQLIVTDSPFSQARLQHYFPSLSERIKVVLPGLDEWFLTLLTKPSEPKLVTDNYILCVSAFYPHKRIMYLLELWPKILAARPDLKLVLVGHNGNQLFELSDQLRATPGLYWFPKVSLAKLARLYHDAKMFVFPSVYEGFGFPVYEALNAGLPTIVGNKQPYLPDVQALLHEFTFSAEADAPKILKLLRTPKRVVHLKQLSYHEGAKQILQLLETLS